MLGLFRPSCRRRASRNGVCWEEGRRSSASGAGRSSEPRRGTRSTRQVGMRGPTGRVKRGFVMHEFLEACGLDGRLRLDLDGPAGPVRLALEQPFAVIGRNVGADLTLSDRRVSRRHAYVQAIAGEVFCVDLGSRAGILWGRHRRRSGWIDREQGVVINPFRIRRRPGGRSRGIGPRGQPAREAIRGPRPPERRAPGVLSRGDQPCLLEDEPAAGPGGEVPSLPGPTDHPRASRGSIAASCARRWGSGPSTSSVAAGSSSMGRVSGLDGSTTAMSCGSDRS